VTDCLTHIHAGAERQIYELAKGIDKDRFRLTIVSLECGGTAPKELIEQTGCRLKAFPVKRIYGFSGVINGVRFLRFLKEDLPDILMTYHFSSDIWGSVLGRMAKVPVIISNRRDTGFWRRRHHVWAYRMTSRWVAQVVVNARASQEKFVKEEGLVPGSLTLIPNGVAAIDDGDLNTDEQWKLLSDLDVKEEDQIILHVANLKRVKGHRYLLEALVGVIPRFRHTKLIVVGEDNMQGSIQRYAESLGISSNVIFLGKRSDVKELLSFSDICVLPSLSEGLSNAVMEYMAAGKPVIATAVGGNTDLVQHGETGWLVEKANADALQSALCALLQDVQMRERMGAAGRVKVLKDFPMEKMVRRYEKLFDDMAPQRGRVEDVVSDVQVQETTPVMIEEKKQAVPKVIQVPVEPEPAEPAPVSPPVDKGGTTRVLHLISSIGLFGAEQVALTLGRAFQDGPVQAIVGALHNSHNPHLEIIDVARTHETPTAVFSCRGKFDARAVLAIKNYILQHKIDLVHTHNYKSNLIGLLAAKWAGVPTVATVHGFTDMDTRVSWYERLDRWVMRRFFDRLVVVTSQMLPDFPDDMKDVIPNGMNMDALSQADDSDRFRSRWKIVRSDLVITTVGRLSKEKNQTLLLKALYPLLRRDPRLKVLIVGEGPERLAVEKYIRSRNLTDQVIMTGLLKDVAAVYQSTDVFVLPSLTEGVPMTILEAMAYHCPVVATAVGGVPEIIREGKTGLLVPSNNEKAMRAAIERLLNEKRLRHDIVERAFEYVVSEHTMKKMCDRYESVYQGMLKQ